MPTGHSCYAVGQSSCKSLTSATFWVILGVLLLGGRLAYLGCAWEDDLLRGRWGLPEPAFRSGPSYNDVNSAVVFVPLNTLPGSFWLGSVFFHQ